MLAWMVYVLVVSSILGAAAFAAERSAQIGRVPTRWLWAGSIFASLLLPAVISSISVQLPNLSSANGRTELQQVIPLRQVTLGAVQPSAWLAVEPGGTAATADVDTILTRAWGATSGVIFLAILLNSAQLHRRQRAWERQVIGGAQVYVSEDVGPAVVGLLRPCIVVPRWITRAGPETQALVLAHEQSHLDASDAQLLTVAILLIVAMPWNLPLWWQLRRLRFAIEVDCDARVLEGGHDVSRYGETLVMVGERQSGRAVTVAAMSESKSFLEQRIRKMLSTRKKFAWASATAMGGLGFVLAASAAVVSPPNAGPPSAQLREASGAQEPDETRTDAIQMVRYKNSALNFALDVPANWTSFPPIPGLGPYQVIRFSSNGSLMIISRQSFDPSAGPELTLEHAEEGLVEGGFSNFVTGETMIGSREVRTLDSNRKMPDGKTWSCRQYFIADGNLRYMLGFGTTNRDAMFGLYDQVAKSFVFGKTPS